VLTRDAVRSLDRAAIEQLGIPGIILMENAAAAIERECTRLLEARPAPPNPPNKPDHPGRAILIVAGAGNNAGDGFALARRLWVAGHRSVRIALALPPNKIKGDAATNLSIAHRMGIPIAPADDWNAAADQQPGALLIVDALLGTGLDRPLEGPIAHAARQINAARERGAFVLAIDIPTGLDADTGKTIGDLAVTADHTITLAAMKPGLLKPEARQYTGTVTVAGIGVPHELIERFA
jgi:NAD(P)H-hydrate epimerase